MGRGIRTAPKRLIERLRLVAEGGGHKPAGNLAGLGAGTTTSVEPMRRGDPHPDGGRPACDPGTALGNEAHRCARHDRGRRVLRLFKPRQIIHPARLSQAIDPLGKIRIFQNFNLSRGRIHTTHVRIARTIPIERMNYLKDLHYCKEIRGLVSIGRSERSLNPLKDSRARRTPPARAP